MTQTYFLKVIKNVYNKHIIDSLRTVLKRCSTIIVAYIATDFPIIINDKQRYGPRSDRGINSVQIFWSFSNRVTQLFF